MIWEVFKSLSLLSGLRSQSFPFPWADERFDRKQKFVHNGTSIFLCWRS